MKTLVTFAGHHPTHPINVLSGKRRNYKAEADRLAVSATKWGFTPTIWDHSTLAHSGFYKTHLDIFSAPNYGYLFKPFIIRQVMDKIPKGGVVLWVDSSHEIISDPQVLIEWAVNHKGFFIHDHKNVKRNRSWTRRSAFVLIDCDSERYWDAHMMQANQLLFVKSPRTMQFVDEWIRWCTDSRIILGADIGKNELPEFANKNLALDHRFEQAVLSILVEKYCMEYAPFSLSAQVFNESEVLLD